MPIAPPRNTSHGCVGLAARPLDRHLLLRGELSATTQNCESYCAAKARSHAEAECSGEADQASCRAAEEASYEASCETSCTSSTTHVIVAETALSATALADLNASALTGAAIGEVQADLTFDRIEDDQGETVEEAP